MGTRLFLLGMRVRGKREDERIKEGGRRNEGGRGSLTRCWKRTGDKIKLATRFRKRRGKFLIHLSLLVEHLPIVSYLSYPRLLYVHMSCNRNENAIRGVIKSRMPNLVVGETGVEK